MTAKIEDIGLLLVHGVGEQKRLEHLKQTAKDLESTVASKPGLIRLAVNDDTAAADPNIVIDAIVREGQSTRRVRLHLHEAWWADLGITGGLFEQLRFWLWGLGQWGAEVVAAGSPWSNTTHQMVNPRFSPHQPPDARLGFWRRLPYHLLLFGAAVLALLTFFTWYWAKRLIAFLKGRLPNPDLISLYLGDVMVYQRAGGPGRGTSEDPDMPVRTTIRRRIVRGMTRMAARPYHRWYILAHSLGTVPAFNGLQELELTLPNYLTEAEWKALPRTLRTSSPFIARDQSVTRDRMMPRRPPWLADSDGISRAALFRRFAGLVTYGSPLDKFAAIWPRIVPLNKQAKVFPEKCEWLNLYDPTDPVGAWLDAFQPPHPDPNEPASKRKALEPDNVACRALWVFLLSHIYYLTPWRVRDKVIAAAIADSLLSGGKMSLEKSAEAVVMKRGAVWLRHAFALLQLALLFLLLISAAAYLLTLIENALSCKKSICTVGIDWTVEELRANAWLILKADILIVFVVGTVRGFVDLLRSYRDEQKKRREAEARP